MSTVRRPCPQCNRGPKDTALAVTTDERGTVSYCHRCGYMTSESIERIPAMRSEIVVRHTPQLEWSSKAESIWQRRVPLAGTVGATYLRNRGCVLPPADSDLGFLPASGNYLPSLCARITDVKTAKPLSLHFTRLAADGSGKAGTERDRTLLKGHRKQGGCIRLWPDEAVHIGLSIAEGIESALAAAHIFTPIWATVDAGNLAAFPVLNGILALTIFADHDEAGLKSARECAKRWKDAGRYPRILTPLNAGQDAADVVSA